MPPRDITLRLPHLTLAAQAWGDESLPPLLAVHGWLDNAASFAMLAPLLAEHFHVVAIDWPGHGHSQHRPPGTWYHYVDYADELHGAVKALGWKRYTLLGHSLGGAIACAYAAVHTQEVERLLLLESLGPLSAQPELGLDHLRRAYAQREAFSEKTLRVFRSIDDAVAARAAANGLGDEASRLLVERGLNEVPGGWSWSSDPRLTLASPLRFTETAIQSALRGIEAPTFLILAEPATSYLPRDVMDSRAACIPHIEVVRMAGHHHLHMEDAPNVARALLDFCQR